LVVKANLMRQPANGMQMAGLWEVCYIGGEVRAEITKGEMLNFEV